LIFAVKRNLAPDNYRKHRVMSQGTVFRVAQIKEHRRKFDYFRRSSQNISLTFSA